MKMKTPAVKNTDAQRKAQEQSFKDAKLIRFTDLLRKVRLALAVAEDRRDVQAVRVLERDEVALKHQIRCLNAA